MANPPAGAPAPAAAPAAPAAAPAAPAAAPAAAAAVPALAPAVPPAAPAIAFALTPALAVIGIIDLSTTSGHKLWKAGTAALPTEYDGTPQGLHLFLYELEHRAEDFGWDRLVTIDIAPPGAVRRVYRNLITQHRTISLENVKANAVNYVAANNRDTQNSRMMLLCILASLDKDTRALMMTETEAFTITEGYPPVRFKDGPTLLKVLLRKIHVETRATNFYLRQQMTKLPSKFIKLNYNVEKFNQEVSLLIYGLASGGEKSSDLSGNLFAAYLSAKDRTFRRYMEDKKTAYDEGTDFTSQQLMQLALTKYNQLLLEDKWNAPSEEEQQIIALTAQLKKEKAAREKLAKNVKPDTEPDSDKPTWLQLPRMRTMNEWQAGEHFLQFSVGQPPNSYLHSPPIRPSSSSMEWWRLRLTFCKLHGGCL
mmetsp:Transcript_21623/g.36824  ORF Transcript_21623/g.36824 Transcript_21623/m.36824 type:complete len:423 (-) Transcript_21623:240-1508(-)